MEGTDFEQDTKQQQSLGKQFLQLIVQKLSVINHKKRGQYEKVKKKIGEIIGDACSCKPETKWVHYCFGVNFMKNSFKNFQELEQEIKEIIQRNQSDRTMESKYSFLKKIQQLSIHQASQVNSTIGMNSYTKNNISKNNISKNNISKNNISKNQISPQKMFDKKYEQEYSYRKEEQPTVLPSDISSLSYMYEDDDQKEIANLIKLLPNESDQYLEKQVINWNSQLNFVRQKLQLQQDLKQWNEGGKIYYASVTIKIKKQSFVECENIDLKGQGTASNSKQARNLASKDVLAKIYRKFPLVFQHIIKSKGDKIKH